MKQAWEATRLRFDLAQGSTATSSSSSLAKEKRTNARTHAPTHVRFQFLAFLLRLIPGELSHQLIHRLLLLKAPALLSISPLLPLPIAPPGCSNFSSPFRRYRRTPARFPTCLGDPATRFWSLTDPLSRAHLLIPSVYFSVQQNVTPVLDLFSPPHGAPPAAPHRRSREPSTTP